MMTSIFVYVSLKITGNAEYQLVEMVFNLWVKSVEHSIFTCDKEGVHVFARVCLSVC